MVLQAAVQKILVVGGNGFIGSAVCKAALARGMQVTSISSSGKPYTTPKGHSPAWTSKVDWRAADAHKPETYEHILPEMTGVVHTLGTLLEDTGYKKALREGDPLGVLGSVVRGLTGGRVGGANPLEEAGENGGSYAKMNRDSALRVCEAFVNTRPSANLDAPRPFVFLSAEDVFRPLIPSGYIEMKREAERRIEEIMIGHAGYRSVFIRPSLVYHAHYRPLTSPAAALLDLSATLHARAPHGVPTPAGAARVLGALTAGTEGMGSPLNAVANALTIPPIHVDHVAEACSVAVDVERADVRGPLGVRDMRELIGWAQKGQPLPEAGAHSQTAGGRL